MAITYPIDFPNTIGLTDSVLRARTVVSKNISPFSLAEQIYTWGGERWELDIVLPIMNRSQVEEFYSFMTKLRGMHGRFTCFVPSATTARGTVKNLNNGDILVKGASQTGRELIIDGFANNQSNVVLAGDYFQLGTGLNTRLYKVLDNVSSNGTGAVTLDIFPALRSSPNDNDVVYFNNPKGLFRLSENVFDMPSDMNNLFNLSFSAIEAVDGT